jgi:hypothetical protein
MTNLPYRLRVAMVSAAVFVAALALALVIDQKTPGQTMTAPLATFTATAPATRVAQAPPWATSATRADRKAERRRERRGRQSRGRVAAQPPMSGTRSAPVPVPDPGRAAYLDGLAEEAAITAARQNERVREIIDADAAAYATHSAETIDRIHQAGVAEIQDWCEPSCLDSPRD